MRWIGLIFAVVLLGMISSCNLTPQKKNSAGKVGTFAELLLGAKDFDKARAMMSSDADFQTFDMLVNRLKNTTEIQYEFLGSDHSEIEDRLLYQFFVRSMKVNGKRHQGTLYVIVVESTKQIESADMSLETYDPSQAPTPNEGGH